MYANFRGPWQSANVHGNIPSINGRRRNAEPSRIARLTSPLLQRSTTADRTDYNSPPRKLSSRTTMNSIFRQSALRRMYLINNARTNTPLPKPHGVSGVRSKQIMSVGIQTENCSAGTAVSQVTMFCQTLSVNTWGTDACCLIDYARGPLHNKGYSSPLRHLQMFR